jgi:hypothetical protein
MAKRKKRQPVNSTALNEQKNEINHFDPLFLAEKASVSKMTERAPESNDCHAIVAARCR